MKQFFLRFYLTTCLLFLLIQDLKAQEYYKDIVFLKDGSRVKGQIIGFDSLGGLKVKTGKDDFFLVPKAHIKKFKVNGAYSPSQNIAFTKQDGFINVTQLGFLGGSVENSACFEIYNGYRFNPYISVGLVSGINTYQKGLLMPVGIGFQSVFLNKKISPTAFVSAGKGLTWPNKIKDWELSGGTYWNARAGIRIKNGANSAFTFQIGYNHQRSQIKSTYGTWNGKENFSIEKTTYRRMALMLGFSF